MNSHTSKLGVKFYQSDSGSEPVRDWLREMPTNDRRIIGVDIKTVQFGWPVGMPVVRKIEKGLWEVRSQLAETIARVLFTVVIQDMVLLHGFIKKSRKTPDTDLLIARRRRAKLSR